VQVEIYTDMSFPQSCCMPPIKLHSKFIPGTSQLHHAHTLQRSTTTIKLWDTKLNGVNAGKLPYWYC